MANTSNEASNGQIMHHHGTSDPADYQVDDVLVCIAAGHGLQVGELYIAQAVARRKAHGRVVTTVTVTTPNFKFIQVLETEAFLRRTRVLVEVMAPNGNVTLHSFPDPEQLNVWCAFTRTPANRTRNKRYVEAEPTPPASCRFTAMCIPGELDDGSDATWYVCDLMFRTSDKGRRRSAVAQSCHLDRARIQPRAERERERARGSGP
jgi:hypothetical protein